MITYGIGKKLRKGALGAFITILEEQPITKQKLMLHLERAESSIWRYLLELNDNGIIVCQEDGYFVIKEFGFLTIFTNDDFNKLSCAIMKDNSLSEEDKRCLLTKLANWKHLTNN